MQSKRKNEQEEDYPGGRALMSRIGNLILLQLKDSLEAGDVKNILETSQVIKH